MKKKSPSESCLALPTLKTTILIYCNLAYQQGSFQMTHLAYNEFFAPLSLISNQSENDYIRTANQVQNQTKFICSLRDVSRAFQRRQLVVALVVAMHTDQKPLCYLILYKPMFFL